MLFNRKKGKGIMCISLDTEFFWGVHDTKTYASYGENVYNGRLNAIPKILETFEQYQIHATWAIVGAIMAKDKNTLLSFLPQKEKWPSYNNELRSPYKLLDEIGQDYKKDKLFIGLDIVEKINNARNQYIGSHTFSHYYCKEEGQMKEEFEADMQSAVNIAGSIEIYMRSVVFPKNEINNDYVASCKQLGFEVYRGIEENWIYKIHKFEFLCRFLRFIDSYLPLSGSNTFIPKFENGLLNVRGSRIFRPYNEKLKCLEWMKLMRIKCQMTVAAKKGEIFHLWWHPHNFGKNVEKNLYNLEVVLKHYRKLSKKYGFESKAMEEILDMYREEK